MTLIDSEKLITALKLDKKILTMLLNNSEQSNKFLLDCKEFMALPGDDDLDPAELEQMSQVINKLYDNVINKINILSGEADKLDERNIIIKLPVDISLDVSYELMNYSLTYEHHSVLNDVLTKSINEQFWKVSGLIGSCKNLPDAINKRRGV
ncbi:MAG TPA: hypothetical protein O0Y17_01140 [Methanocorpusculum sp.]|nr:hypothetical protein [Methanocorpusculum sp.]